MRQSKFENTDWAACSLAKTNSATTRGVFYINISTFCVGSLFIWQKIYIIMFIRAQKLPICSNNNWRMVVNSKMGPWRPKVTWHAGLRQASMPS